MLITGLNYETLPLISITGIFVNDIIDAAPIDKYFELFKPNAGGQGGELCQ